MKHNLSSNYTDSDIVEFYSRAESLYLLANSAVAEKVIDYYQLLNDDQNLINESFDLIASIYDVMLSTRPDDIALCETAYFFFLNVMDDEKKAKLILENGISAAQEKISDLKKIAAV